MVSCSISDSQSAVIGITAQLVQQAGNIALLRDLGMVNSRVKDCVNIGTFQKGLTEQLRERRLGCKALIPGITPGFVVQVQAGTRIGNLVRNQLGGGQRIRQKEVFHKSNAASLSSGWVCQSTASKPDSKYGAVNHPGSYLEIVVIGDRVVGFVDAF